MRMGVHTPSYTQVCGMGKKKAVSHICTCIYYYMLYLIHTHTQAHMLASLIPTPIRVLVLYVFQYWSIRSKLKFAQSSESEGERRFDFDCQIVPASGQVLSPFSNSVESTKMNTRIATSDKDSIFAIQMLGMDYGYGYRKII